MEKPIVMMSPLRSGKTLVQELFERGYEGQVVAAAAPAGESSEPRDLYPEGVDCGSDGADFFHPLPGCPGHDCFPSLAREGAQTRSRSSHREGGRAEVTGGLAPVSFEFHPVLSAATADALMAAISLIRRQVAAIRGKWWYVAKGLGPTKVRAPKAARRLFVLDYLESRRHLATLERLAVYPRVGNPPVEDIAR